MSFTLETIFRLVDLPKAEGRPPRDAKVVRVWGEGEFIDCARFFNGKRVRAETGTLVRKVYLCREVRDTFLYFVEERKAEGALAG